MARLMSEAEQRRRQKLQSKIGRTTSTLGLSALGVTGAAAVAAKSPKTLTAIRKIPGLKKATVKGMENTAVKSGIVSGGIGGVGGFNQASIYSAESRRRKQAVPVKKNLGIEMGYYGEEGHPLTHEEIEAEIEKAWTPSASNYDSEQKRGKRARAYQGAGLVGGGAAGTFAGVQAHKAIQEGKKLKGGSQIRRLKPVVAHGGKAAAGAAAGVAAITASSKIGSKRRDSWQPYAKRDAASAFGVDHSDNPNGQHRETEN